MRVVLTQKMVVGHVMRYPGEVVDFLPVDTLERANVETLELSPVETSEIIETPRRKRANVQRANVPTGETP